ncbi:hypothetical protein KZ686_24075 [Cupriavidus cauae]|uniref:Uncharacterized protein n=1 Tax=Cupriavidus cauae TaxID=2608999 RepID=A0A5M8AFD9_9BURK|nr:MULTISPECIES: hypothetical protein [Cupriavidus]KAA6120961.1 hypothetical protein F1599_17590 [Cupriavidus cauae]MCA7082588.1 hypothetical protein [Cupriavidus sp. DB3]UZN51389.1 hypothetical protein KZ686_24075 [Cupriavidus cauae]
MKLLKHALLTTTLALAALPALAGASAIDAGSLGARNVYADGAHQGHVDPFTDGARGGTRDVFSDGAATGGRDVHADGA